MHKPIYFEIVPLYDPGWNVIRQFHRRSLYNYFERGLECTDFLMIVLEQQQEKSTRYNEGESLYRDYTKFLKRYAPDCSWGSPGIVEEWIKRGGLVGRY